MLEVTHGDVAWIESLGEIFCLTFIKQVEETEALKRLGAVPDTLRPRTLQEAQDAYYSYEAGYPVFAFVLNLGTWALLIEPDGFKASLIEPLTALSRGTEVVSVQRHEYADHGFRYAVDGTLVTGFEPTWPQVRWGSEPDRLVGKMRAAGLDPVPPEDEDEDDTYISRAYIPAFLLAGLITGAVPHPDTLTGQVLSAEIEPWFNGAPPSLPHGPTDSGMRAALEAAPPRLLRTVAARETMRLATVLNLHTTPGLAEAVAAAERGEPVTISPESELGTHIRSWLIRSRQAGGSLNDPSAQHKMSDDQRTAAHMRAWFVNALKGALWPEPLAAARCALYPLTQGPPLLRDAAQEAAILHALRGDQSN
ncbi:DUF6461 domain-containing protein [Actinomadura violacea]|uniref:Uncharacterized protein n=1 Tax=Actinomadura violacea TaxID=2819934 RepID=A0ABS3RT45_9ACTN|nr:DUF6461 domain-containing protein [Actinomadura violacea]MBO2459816.1 hypothetical protein [Actinomadura violacea]